MSTIKLSYPITHDDKTISEITMRRPTVRDHIWLDHQEAKMKRDGKVIDDVERDSMMYARLTEEDYAPEVLQKLDMSDWGKCRRFYLDCLKPSDDSNQTTETN
ncbi:phage tail assembly protein [Vibrio sp. C8]